LKYDQVHFGVSEPEKAAEWYRRFFGGERITEPVDPRIMLGTTRLIFLKVDNPRPSAGSVFDHVAFSVAEVDATIRRMEMAGARVVEPAHDEPDLFRSGMVDDPWGVRIEVLHDPETTGFHHVHLRVPDPQRTMQRYVDAFGGETARIRGKWSGVRYGAFGNWVLMDKGQGEPSAGHAIDHIGWDTRDIQQTHTHLKALGVEFLNEPRKFGKGGAFFVEGSDGDKLELVQR
jgi:predicted enzyme related to lactoylglutathione lyase